MKLKRAPCFYQKKKGSLFCCNRRAAAARAFDDDGDFEGPTFPSQSSTQQSLIGLLEKICEIDDKDEGAHLAGVMELIFDPPSLSSFLLDTAEEEEEGGVGYLDVIREI